MKRGNLNSIRILITILILTIVFVMIGYILGVYDTTRLLEGSTENASKILFNDTIYKNWIK